MADQQQLGPRIRDNHLTMMKWLAAVFFAALPAIAVKSTSLAGRVAWFSFLLIFLMGLLITLFPAPDGELRDPKGPFIRRYRPYLTEVLAATFLVAEIAGIVATYAATETPLIWSFATYVSALGASLFSVVDKYATQIGPPLAPQTLIKAQAIATLFLIAGFLSTTVWVVYIFAMPSDERQQLLKAPARYQKAHSEPVALILGTFGILMALSAFYGWFEFNAAPSTKCIMDAACYVNDDLALSASALGRTFASYIFSVGGAMMLCRSFAQDGS